MQCLIGDNTGRVIAEATPLVESVSEILNGIGRAVLTFPRHDPKLTAANLAFGNRLLIRFSNDLVWGGYIDPPRKWTSESVAITGYSGEGLLDWRATGKSRYFDGVSKGAIFSAVHAETLPVPGLAIGQVWSGGAGHSPDYHLESLLDLVQRSLCDRMGAAEFNVTSDFTGGVITFRSNFYERRGQDTSLKLEEGANVTEVQLLEQGDIINDWTLAGADVSGEGSDGWGDGRLTATASSSQSIALYGRRQGTGVFPDIKVGATLELKARSLMEEFAFPHNIFSLTAIDELPAKFSSYGVGDSLLLQSYSCGFGGIKARVRVIGREYFPQTRTANLIVQEVT